MLNKMGNKLEHIEDDIFEGRSREVVHAISDVKQEIINFRKIVRPQRSALRDLERTRRYVPEDLEVYFDDIQDANERIWDLLENYKEVIEALEATNESVLSHQVNDVLRVLTAFSVMRAAADAHRVRRRHERALPGRRSRPRGSGRSSARCSSCSSGWSSFFRYRAGSDPARRYELGTASRSCRRTRSGSITITMDERTG